jgi:hypothetical protein
MNMLICRPIPVVRATMWSLGRIADHLFSSTQQSSQTQAPIAHKDLGIFVDKGSCLVTRLLWEHLHQGEGMTGRMDPLVKHCLDFVATLAQDLEGGNPLLLTPVAGQPVEDGTTLRDKQIRAVQCDLEALNDIHIKVRLLPPPTPQFGPSHLEMPVVH